MANMMAQPQIPKLTATNYGNWSIQIKVLLGSYDNWDIVKSGYNEPTDIAAEAALTNAEKMILKETRKRIKRPYIQLFKSKDLPTISIDELVGSLQVHEQRMNHYDDTSDLEKALQSKVSIGDSSGSSGSVRGIGRFRGGYQGGRGRGRQSFNRGQNSEGFRSSGRGQNFRGRGRGGFQRGDKSHFQCYNCNKFDHFSYECKAPKVEERSHFAATKEDKDIGTAMFLTYKGDEESKKNVWYLDSGSSNHMTGHKDLFTEIDETISREVTFGDSSKIPVKGKGTITIVSKNDEKNI
ncbi:uncharacterized protein LOC141671627 [Apium graveolens]|uniref:uncharacterized protein LOC141671627 n=1 Tax=Apium graveolens TaxID=4045 RepID=UPI003D7929EC